MAISGIEVPYKVPDVFKSTLQNTEHNHTELFL